VNSSTSSKVDEDRLRRVAARRGYRLKKIRRVDRRAVDYGTFELINEATERGRVGEIIMSTKDLRAVEKFLDK